MPKTPLRFHNREELVRALRRYRCDLKEHYSLGPEEATRTAEEVTGWISGNTYRAFHHCKRPPSQVAQEWGVASITDEKLMDDLAGVRSAPEYDEWHRKWCDGLRRFWIRETGKPMSLGASRKLPNILMKGMLSDWRSTLWTNATAVRIAKWAHVPLDAFALSCIRRELSGPSPGKRTRYLIPSGASMGWVPDQKIYMRIQNKIREIAQEAGVHPLAFDSLAWDSRH